MTRLLASLIVLLLAPSAAADVLQKNRIPSGARWIAHLDVEALKSSRLYDLVHQESARGGSNEMDEGLAEVQVMFGLDPTMDFTSVTLYCAAQSPESCVALLAGNARIDRALEKLKSMENYHTTPADHLTLHTWGGDHDTWYAYVHRKEGSDERVVVASQDAKEVVRGVSVLQHGGESLAEADRPAIQGAPAAGSILFAAAGESLNGFGEVEPLSAVAKLAKAVQLDVGEDRGALRAHVVLDTRSPEDAQRIQQVLQGAVALVGLVGGDEHEQDRSRIQQLVDALRLSVSNTRVDAEFRYDVKTLFEDLKSLHDSDSNSDAKSERRHRARERRREKKVDVR